VKFATFLHEAQEQSFWQKNSVYLFKGETYPALFFQELFSLMRKNENVIFQRLSPEMDGELLAHLQQSFLGQKVAYWLANKTPNIKGKKSQHAKIMDFLVNYTGPHTIAFFVQSDVVVSTKKNNNLCIVELPSKISLNELDELGSFLSLFVQQAKRQLLNSFLSNQAIFSLDAACMLLYYLQVTRIRSIPELKQYAKHFIEEDMSLYTLSRLFWAKQAKEFFSFWENACEQYPPLFWVAYWSEQLWNAYFFVRLARQDNIKEAYRYAYRLPFSFKRADWRSCSLKELQCAHAFLYEIDFAFKRGSSFCSLDLFYNNYFMGKFV